MKQELLKGGTDQLSLGLKDHGIAVVPSSCSIRILDGGTVLESGTATSGLYTPGSAVVGDTHQDLTVEWTYSVVSGPNRKSVELVDVVLFKLYPVISDQDIVREDASLVSSDYAYYGAVSEASATGLIDYSLKGRRDDWVGSHITFTSGSQEGRQYPITAFSPTTGLLSYTATTYPSVDDAFVLRRTFQGELDQAWADIYDKLVQACAASSGDRPSLVMSPDRLRRPHLMKTLEKLFRGMADDPAGVAWAKAEYYKGEFEACWNGLALAFSHPNATEPTKTRDGSTQWGLSR